MPRIDNVCGCDNRSTAESIDLSCRGSDWVGNVTHNTTDVSITIYQVSRSRGRNMCIKEADGDLLHFAYNYRLDLWTYWDSLFNTRHSVKSSSLIVLFEGGVLKLVC
mmetsp:Transcript_22181/g.33783  ORF Transcript_22181/g.33783 Transcript_22181/m.33783 type:complete len:107 (+) Transcript_22181:1367-1687(+)